MGKRGPKPGNPTSKAFGNLSDEDRCTAKNSRGERCGRRRTRGLTVCHTHGGAIKHARKAGLKRWHEGKIMEDLERKKLVGVAAEGTTNPLDQLQKLTTELIYFKDQLTHRVNDLGDNLAHHDMKDTEQVKAEIEVYLKVIDRLTKTLDIALKHDIEGKKLALEQAKADMVAGLIIRTLIHAGLTGDQLDGAKNYMYQQLKEVEQV